ncbi:MAG: ABC transporter substrate-binding protein [Candidatus Omnitrophica bacterium]|nr:ABC transporter substrate-binding protein [Candidatus Omnitrophota bacterium]
MKKTAFLILFFILFASAAGSAEKPAQRIISLGPVITEELYLLSSGDKLVGCTTWCKRPLAAGQKPKVGNVQEINLESVIALKPDVVLATVLTDPRAVTKLRGMGIRVVEVPNARDFAGLCRVLQLLGEITGQEKEARQIIAEAREQVLALKARIKNLPKVKVFVQVGVNPLVTIGRESFANDLIESAGGENIVAQPGYLQYSREQVLASSPEVMFISSMGFDGEKEKRNWQKFGALKPVMEGRVFILDEYLLCSPTPVSFVETLKTVIRYLHPEVGI